MPDRSRVVIGLLRPWRGPGCCPARVSLVVSVSATVLAAGLATVAALGLSRLRGRAAGEMQVLRRVMLPLLAPGIAAGAALAFVVSFGDFAMAQMTAGPGPSTRPVFIRAQLRRPLMPEINAMCMIVLARVQGGNSGDGIVMVSATLAAERFVGVPRCTSDRAAHGPSGGLRPRALSPWRQNAGRCADFDRPRPLYRVL